MHAVYSTHTGTVQALDFDTKIQLTPRPLGVRRSYFAGSWVVIVLQDARV